MACCRQQRSQSKERPLVLAGSLWITAHEPVPANDQEIEEHHHTVAEHVDFCSGVVPPPDSYFRGSQAVTFCEEEYFRVESEALDTLLFEDDSGRLTDEGFETALRV